MRPVVVPARRHAGTATAVSLDADQARALELREGASFCLGPNAEIGNALSAKEHGRLAVKLPQQLQN